MKTRRVPYLQMSLERFTAATTALFSASEQAHCAVVVCDCECTCDWITQRVFQYPPKWLQHSLVVTWLVPRETAAVSAHVLCTLFEVIIMRRVHVCLVVTCHLHFDRMTRIFTCYCGNTGVERIPK